MAYNIVTNYKIITEIKKCRYFKINLGLSATMESKNSEERLLNRNDQFGYYYNTQYKTTIYGQGNIGDIKFYTDHYIKEDVIAVYYNEEEFIYNFDFTMVKEKGIEIFLGHILKKLEADNEERVKNKEDKKIEAEQKLANPDILSKSPGAVTYDDIKAYMQKKNAERFKE
jgi:hypothetical protein